MSFLHFQGVIFVYSPGVLGVKRQITPLSVAKNCMFGSKENCYVTSAIFRTIITNISFTGHEAGKIK